MDSISHKDDESVLAVTKTDVEVEDSSISPQKNRIRLFIILSSILLFLIGVGIIAWLFLFNGIYLFKGIPLTKYSNDEYSIMVPTSYTKVEHNLGSSGSDTIFKSLKGAGSGDESTVYIMSGPVTDKCKKECLLQIDSSYSSGESATNKNVVISKESLKGMNARLVSYDIVKDKSSVGKYHMAMMISNTRIYEIIVTSLRSDPGLAVSASKIIDSFELK